MKLDETKATKARDKYLRNNTQTTGEYATARDAWDAAVAWAQGQLAGYCDHAHQQRNTDTWQVHCIECNARIA